MKIIGHRGAAKLALENTVSALEVAASHHVDAVEFDIHQTSDGHLVLFHDSDLKRLVNGDGRRIKQLSLAELQAITLPNNEHIPTLEEAFSAIGSLHTVIEIKQLGISDAVLEAVRIRPGGTVTITSFLHSELRRIKKQRPELPIFAAEHFSPFEIIASARRLRAQGITINAWLLNPLTYLLCRRYKLDIIAYTVNSPFIAGFLYRLYPHIMICTDRPDRFNKHRSLIRKRRT